MRVYTVCHSNLIFWTHISLVRSPNYSDFLVFGVIEPAHEIMVLIT